jgi:hypothetical protein
MLCEDFQTCSIWNYDFKAPVMNKWEWYLRWISASPFLFFGLEMFHPVFWSSSFLHGRVDSFIYSAQNCCLMIWSCCGLVQINRECVSWHHFCQWWNVLSCKVSWPFFFCKWTYCLNRWCKIFEISKFATQFLCTMALQPFIFYFIL